MAKDEGTPPTGERGMPSMEYIQSWIEANPDSKTAKLRERIIHNVVNDELKDNNLSPIEETEESADDENEVSEYEEEQKPHFEVDEKSQGNNQNQLSPNNPLPMGGTGKNTN